MASSSRGASGGHFRWLGSRAGRRSASGSSPGGPRLAGEGGLPAYRAYNAGMASIQYTVRGVPPELDERLREEARETGKSLNALVVETLAQAKLPGHGHHDLDWFIASASPDAHEPETEAQEWLDSLPDELE